MNNKRYFMSQKQMRETRWAEAVINSKARRRGEKGYPTHPMQCGCGCGPVSIFKEEK